LIFNLEGCDDWDKEDGTPIDDELVAAHLKPNVAGANRRRILLHYTRMGNYPHFTVGYDRCFVEASVVEKD